jgi:hypothetical protein
MPYIFSNPELLMYFLVSLSLFGLSIISILAKSKNLDFFVFFMISIVMIMFYGLRYPGNSDTRMYLYGFDTLTNLQSFGWSAGFYFLMRSIKYIGSSHELYILLSSIYFVVAFMSVGFNYCKDMYYKSLFLIMCFYSWSVLDLAINTYRQGISIPFIILGIYFFTKKNFIYSFVASGIALTLHWGCAAIILLYFFANFISKRIFLLKIISIFTLILFTLSFFVNFGLAEILSKSSLISTLQVFFIGIDLGSKIDAYLGGGVVGARFYDMGSLQRLYFSGEIYISLVVFVLFFLSRNKQDAIVNDRNYLLLYSFFICISLYGVLIISMTWFIRNFYWAVPITPVLYVLLLSYYEKSQSKKHKIALLVFSIWLILFSLETFWRAPLMNMAYPSL